MKITKSKIKNINGSFSNIGLGADANFITLENNNNLEQEMSTLTSDISLLDLQYQILKEEIRTTGVEVSYDLVRNIANFEAREPQLDVAKIPYAKVKNEDGTWSDKHEIGASAKDVDLNNKLSVSQQYDLLSNKLDELIALNEELLSRFSDEDNLEEMIIAEMDF
jgi:hypothetical protein